MDPRPASGCGSVLQETEKCLRFLKVSVRRVKRAFVSNGGPQKAKVGRKEVQAGSADFCN
jgi:hypothetical protein